jgi:hypothetical protein
MGEEAGRGDRDVLYDDHLDAYRPPRTAREEPERELGILGHWERLRVVYNVVLTAEVALLVLGPFRQALRWPNLGSVLVYYALVANLCFCAGPVATAYLHWLGVRGPGVTRTLFALGMILSIGLAAAVLLFYAAMPAGPD